ncbi:MAG: hypothetical protein ACLR17_19705 [Enterobacteriaceae bacterium]
MNNIALIVKLRELLVIFMHTRSLPEKAADALRYCQEHLPIAEIPIGAYGEYSDIFEQIVFYRMTRVVRPRMIYCVAAAI